MKKICCIVAGLLVWWAEAGLSEPPGAASDTLDVEVFLVQTADSMIIAGAGTLQGVRVGTKGVVYVPVIFGQQEKKNRLARGSVVSCTNNTCQLRLLETTAPIPSACRVLLYDLQPPADRFSLTRLTPKGPQGKVPFYKRKWFWPAVGSAALVAAVIMVSGGSSKSNQGTVVVQGHLP